MKKYGQFSWLVLMTKICLLFNFQGYQIIQFFRYRGNMLIETLYVIRDIYICIYYVLIGNYFCFSFVIQKYFYHFIHCHHYIIIKMYRLLFLILFLTSAISQPSHKNKAILFSSSLGYYNIRQQSNIITIYNHLKKLNFRDQDILLLVAEMHTCSQKNHKYGTLSFIDGQYNNIFHNVQVDYHQSQITAKSVQDIFMGNYGQYVLNKRKFSLEGGDMENFNIFIYITGHGGDFYFKVREKQALIDQQFMHIFAALANKHQNSKINRISNKIALLSDSCSAITPFQTVSHKKNTKNFLALASSSFEQKSKSYGFDIELNQPKSDDFTFYMNDILTNLQNPLQMTMKQLLGYMDFAKLQVNSKLIWTQFEGQNTIGQRRKRNKNRKQKWAEGQVLGDYMSKPRLSIRKVDFLSPKDIDIDDIL